MKSKKIWLLFGIEGIFFQFINSVNAYGNALYATNLGATDTQIGLIQTIPNLIAIALLLPTGILSDKARSTKTFPILLLIIMGFSYLFLGSVPVLPGHHMLFYFISLGLCVGVLVNYNASWQIFFGSVTDTENRNEVYATRNRFMFVVGTVTPLLCGALMTALSVGKDGSVSVDGKLLALRIFYYLSAIAVLIQAFVIACTPGGKKSDDELTETPLFQLSSLTSSIRYMIHNHAFRTFFLSIMLFYLTWHLDWSMWYLAEIQYIGMTEMHLGYYNALICILQLLTIGFFAKTNLRRSVHFTFLYAIAGLCLCPVAVMVSASLPHLGLPAAAMPWVFIVLGLIGAFPQSCIGLCTVQMLLDVLPEQNRALITSLYTIFITLSNSLLPLLGVRIYTWMGADYGALIRFNALDLILRLITFALFIQRERKLRA